MINRQKLAREQSTFSHCLKDLAIVYYITVVAFENNVPMYLGEHSLTYCQEYLSERISQMSRHCAGFFLLISDCQQFCKGSIDIPKDLFW